MFAKAASLTPLHPTQGRQVLSRMKERGAHGNVHTYTNMIDTCAKVVAELLPNDFKKTLREIEPLSIVRRGGKFCLS